MQLSIIIVNYNVSSDVEACIESIYRHTTGLDFEIIVVDNNSSDRSIEAINTRFKDLKLILLKENNGFGYANNVAMKQANGEFFLLVNPDILFLDSDIEKLYSFLLANIEVAALGPVQIKPNEGTERYYPFFPSICSRFMQEFGLFNKMGKTRYGLNEFWDLNIKKVVPFKVDWVIGSCLMVRRNVYDELGGFNEAFFLYEEEVEWQYRMRKQNLISMILPSARVLHNHHSSTSKIGVMFVLYQEFRSRIIFSALQFGFPLNIIRKILTISAICFRMLYFNIFHFTSGTVFKNRLYLYLDLLKMTLSTRAKVFKSRFVFNKYALYFQGNRNAKL